MSARAYRLKAFALRSTTPSALVPVHALRSPATDTEITATVTELIVNLAGDVGGNAGLGDLIHAAQPVPQGCPGGLVEHAPIN